MKKLNIHNLKAKEIKKLHTWLRALIQILYFLFLPSVYTAAFAGVKYIFTQIGAGEAIGMTSFVTVLIVLCAYTILFGRFFCGFACAFGSLGDGIHAFYLWCFKKRKKKPVLLSEKITEKLSYLKYLVLTVIAVLCFAGVYGKARGTSPWDVFSMLHAGNFHLQGYLPGVILLIFIIKCAWKKDFSVGICVRWELYSHCFRCFRSLHCTATEKIASKVAVDVRRNAHPGSDFQKTARSKSREIVSNVKNVLIPVQRSISIQELKA